MSKFVTQTVDAVVAVLVFVKPSAVCVALEKQLQEKHLEVIIVDPSVVTQERLAEYAKKDFYKICWVLDDTLKGTAQADIIFQFLFSRLESLVLVTSALSYQAEPKEWVERREADEALLQHFRHYLPHVNILIVIDWFDQPLLHISPVYFLSLQELSQWQGGGVVTKDVVHRIVGSLSRPHSNGIETISEERSFTHEEILSWYTLAHPPEEEVAVAPPPTQLQAAIEQEHDVLQHIPRPYCVEPPRLPRIPNRQQHYEQNIMKIKDRYHKRRLLRPIAKNQVHKQKTQDTSHRAEKAQLQPLEQHLELTIKQLFGTQRHAQRDVRLQKKAVKTVVTRKKQKRQRVVMKLVSAVIIVVIFAVSTVVSFVWMRAHLFSLIVQHANQEQLSDSPIWRSRSTKLLIDVLAKEVQAYQTVFGADTMIETSAVLSAVHQIQVIYEQRREIEMLFEKSIAQIMSQEQGDVFQTLSDVSAQQQSLYAALSVIQTQLQSVSTEFLSDTEAEAVDKILTEIQSSRKQLAVVEQVRQLVPGFLGQEGRRRIALVIQDSQELRPSGGTIQGIYLVTVEKGQIIDKQFYEPAQLAKVQIGEIQTTVDYQKYFNRDNVSLIDAGWSPDFTTTANIISNYLDRNIGRKPDLVVGLTTQTLQELLAKSGEIQMEKGDRITSLNLFERLEANAEPEYYREAYTAVLERALDTPQAALEFFEVLGKEFQEGQAFIVSAQLTENDVLNSLGWAGQVSTPQCPSLLGTEKCRVSTIFQVEANIGINKVNPQIERTIVHTIQVEKEKIRHKRIVTYQNQANTTRWPSGTYRNYVRFYVPNEVKVDSVKVGEELIDLRELDRAETASGQFFGFVVDVPIQTTVPVIIEYSEDFEYEPGKAFAFFDQKQAGTSDESYVLTIQPQGIQAAVVAPKADLDSGRIIFSEPRNKHQFVGVNFR